LFQLLNLTDAKNDKDADPSEANRRSKQVQHDKKQDKMPTRAKRTGEANKFGMTVNK
jgi:hypothetical protein